jgi:predicted metal-binding protein
MGAAMSVDPHRIFVCTSCRYSGSNCRPGFELISKLQDALKLAVPVVGEEFEVSGIACMAGCSRPCTVAFRASEKATYLFGDIDPDEDIDDLVAFAHQYRELEDGWCSSGQRPGKLKRSALARIPAAMIVTEASEAAVS